MLSASKILLIVAVVGVVVAASRFLRGNRGKTQPAKTEPGREPDAVDLKKCRVCDRYVAADSAPCERDDCPNTA